MGCGQSQEGGAYRGLDDSQISSLRDAKLAFASFSFIGSATIIFCYIRCRELRKFAFKLVFLMSVSDCLSAVGDFVSPPEDQCGPCMFQSYMVSIFNLASVLWTQCISHCLYRAVRHHDLDVQRFELRYHLYAWGVPTVLALIPSNGMYGYDNGACWILEKYSYMRFLQFYLPLFFVIIYNGVVYYRVLATLRATLGSTEDQGQRERDMQAFMRMGFYPLVLVVCWFFPIINRFQNWADPERPSYELYMLHRIFASSQGLLNCLVYGMNRTVRQKLPEVCCCRGPASPEAGEADGGIQMSEARAAGKREGGPPSPDADDDAAGPPARAPASDEV